MNSDSQSEGAPVGSRRGLVLTGLVPVVLLLPFINKAWHIDDTVYLLVAEQILSDPRDFYGFEMNWGRRMRPVAEINKNPPGVSYYIAAVAAVAGFREWAVHGAFLLPVFLVGAGTYRIAARYTKFPLVAGLAAGVTPAFLVSSSNAMCEPLMLALYVWGVERWVSGIESKRWQPLVTAAILIGVGTWTKYLALTAVPLLAAYTIAAERRLSIRLLFLLIPFVFVAAYDLLYYLLYGVSAWLESGSFAMRTAGTSGSPEFASHALINCAFLGGAFLTAFLLLLGDRRLVLIALVSAIATCGYVVGRGGLDADYRLYAEDGIRWGYLFQLAGFAAAGMTLLVSAVGQVFRHRDPGALLLACWIGGMFVFCGYVNWSINVRAVLPAAPAIGILAARALSLDAPIQRICTAAAIAGGALVSLAVLYGDYTNAESGRIAGVRAGELAKSRAPGGRLLFQGHLGFQWYLERAGYRHIEVASAPESGHLFASLSDYGFRDGDLCAVKEDAAIIDLATSDCRLILDVEPADARWVATMNRESGAGFYTAYMGELPYFFGPIKPERITFYEVLDADASARDTR